MVLSKSQSEPQPGRISRNWADNTHFYLLKRPPFCSSSSLNYLFITTAVWAAFVHAELAESGARWTLTKALAYASLLGAPPLLYGVYRLLSRPRLLPLIELQAKKLVLPSAAATSSRTTAVAYGDILSVEIRPQFYPKLFSHNLLLQTRHQLIVLPMACFENRAKTYALCAEIRRRISSCQNGTQLLEKLDNRHQLSRQAFATWPWVTYSVVVLLSVIYIAEKALGVLERPFGLVQVGANAPILVAEGQLYRLISANFLHSQFVHIFMNCVAIVYLGRLLERLLGAKRLVLVFLASAIGGATASTLAAEAYFSVGASTAIFGLLGALLIISCFYRTQLPAGFGQSRRFWLYLTFANVALPLWLPQIDLSAHLGGFATGALVCSLLYRNVRPFCIERRVQWQVAAASAGVVAVFALGLTAMTWRATHSGGDDELAVAQALVDAPMVSPHTLNKVAWSFFSTQNASAQYLKLAKTAAEKAVERDPDNSRFLDGLATAYYRLGLYNEAVATQHLALAKNQNRYHFRQMSQFLQAYEEFSGPFVSGEASPGSVRIELESQHQALSKRALRVHFDEPYRDGLVIYAHAVDGNKKLGLLRACWGSTAEMHFRFSPGDKNFFQQWPESVIFKVAYIDGAGCHYRANHWRWRYWTLQEPRQES